MLGNFAYFGCHLLTFFPLKKSGTLSVSNCLDPDQDPSCVRPDLGPNSLQRLSADNRSRCKQGDLNTEFALGIRTC